MTTPKTHAAKNETHATETVYLKPYKENRIALTDLDFSVPEQTFYFWPNGSNTRMRQLIAAGEALTAKVKEQVATSGAYQAAKNLRKQGYPIELALALIAGRLK